MTTTKLGRPPKILDIDEIKLSKDQLTTFRFTIKKHGELRIAGIGIFTVKDVASRDFYHNKARKVITSPARKKLHLFPDAAIKEFINAKGA